MEFKPSSPWSTDLGPQHEVVLSSRARLARNLAGFPFVNRCSPRQCQETLELTRGVLLSDEVAQNMIWVDLNQATRLDRRLLFERQLISRPHAEGDRPRSVAISGDESLSIMVNEEDHLRIQVLAPGLRLEDVYRRVDAIDDAVEAKLDYAFSPRFGYLTACPTNVGTGIRFSAMLHLPAVRMINELDRVRRAAKDLHLAVRGFHGEGTDSSGDFYQVSNQVTLGRAEEDLLFNFLNEIVPQIVQYEAKAREVLLRRNRTLLDDRVYRALGVLRAARLLGVEEAMKLLSRVRLGICTGRLPDLDVAAINGLFLQVQPAHLQVHTGANLSPVEYREARAALVREVLS